MTAGGMNLNVDTNVPQKDSVPDLQRNPMGIMSAMLNAMKGKTFQMKAAMRQVFQAQFSDENIRKSFSQAFNIYPDKPVKVGDSWKKDMTMGGVIAAKSNTTYTVKDIKPDRVILDLNSAIHVGNVVGKQSDTMEVDRKSGLVLTAALNQQFDAPVNMHSTLSIQGKQL